MKLCRSVLSLFVIAVLAVTATAQSPRASQTTSADPTHSQQIYVRPTRKAKLHNYLFDAYGPFPIVLAAASSGINQAGNSPPEWKQGASGYGKRFASVFGIATISTTTRYLLAGAFKEDTIYYPCTCKGAIPRLGHAVVSTFTARRGEDGHRAFSIPALVAPYAGTMTAAYTWYPNRYDAKDAFRMGNYSLLAYTGGNIAIEFLFSGPHSLLRRLHLKSRH